jgi:DNA polymerase
MLREAVIDSSYASWHAQARALLASGVAPGTLVWSISPDAVRPAPVSGGHVRVDRRFVELAQLASRHRAAERWSLLYRVLWRLVHENRKLLEIGTDPDVELLHWMADRVREDVHRLRTFMRLRTIGEAHQEYFVSWHRPDHDIAELVAPFFAKRYPNIRWSLFTPQRTVHWDGRKITLAPGVPSSELPPEDSHAGGEELWRRKFLGSTGSTGSTGSMGSAGSMGSGSVIASVRARSPYQPPRPREGPGSRAR